MEVVGEATEGGDAIVKVRALRPDVVVMDIAMPGTNGLEATRQLKTSFPDVRILLLTMLADEACFFQSLHAGAAGFIVKEAMPEEFLAAVRAVADGKVYLYGSLTKKLLNGYLSQSETDEHPSGQKNLTDREAQVVRLISEGQTGKEIAQSLAISAHTVERHRQNVMTKLGLHSRVDLVKYAIRKGMIDANS